VYDALNVLRAIKIINKQKKSISWVGLPNDSIHAVHRLEEDCIQARERILVKQDRLREVYKQVGSIRRKIILLVIWNRLLTVLFLSF
jgi:chemotaxis signal transduction protein